MSEGLKAWLHPKCFLASDEVQQPPRTTKDSTNYCYRCGVGANNVQPVLRMSIIHEPIVEKVILPEVTPVSEETVDTSKEDEIAALKAQLAELEN